MKNLIGLVLLFMVTVANGQCIDDHRYKCWSKVDPVDLSDFKKVEIDEAFLPVQGQFGISYEVKNFEVFKKNFNKNVKNIFLKRSSEVDTARVKDMKGNLAFVQLQFDLAEIHVREFRKKILLNRKKLLKGFDFLENLQEETLTNFTNEKRQLIEETKNGANQEVLKQWKDDIASRLAGMEIFSAWNKKKIKI